MKQYIKPEIEIELIETGNVLLECSNTAGDGDSFSKHGNYGSFDFAFGDFSDDDFSDDDEDGLFYKKYTVKW